ncbi:MAG TPA: hypothetical protein PKY77_18390 [Phycisphaerae bacterium]|nr:hypothetical protein [Phycisphaerae bacterium]HRY70279.1 hypothetical protein [Phycisphaerae bacterium]HSA27550.1 hypothetical protein [Phycisphaerae bacterium]
MAGIGKRANKPAHRRYQAENRRLVHKRKRVRVSSHGRWTYESLLAHQKIKAAEWARRKELEEAEEKRLKADSPARRHNPLLRVLKRGADRW